MGPWYYDIHEWPCLRPSRTWIYRPPKDTTRDLVNYLLQAELHRLATKCRNAGYDMFLDKRLDPSFFVYFVCIHGVQWRLCGVRASGLDMDR